MTAKRFVRDLLGRDPGRHSPDAFIRGLANLQVALSWLAVAMVALFVVQVIHLLRVLGIV